MRVTEWIRASQAILFEASILPAIVGTAAAIHGGAPFQAVSLGLILLSLVGIQAGANLLKVTSKAETARHHRPPDPGSHSTVPRRSTWPAILGPCSDSAASPSRSE